MISPNLKQQDDVLVLLSKIVIEDSELRRNQFRILYFGKAEEWSSLLTRESLGSVIRYPLPFYRAMSGLSLFRCDFLAPLIDRRSNHLIQLVDTQKCHLQQEINVSGYVISPENIMECQLT
jgi:hypothetical protein